MSLSKGEVTEPRAKKGSKLDMTFGESGIVRVPLKPDLVYKWFLKKGLDIVGTKDGDIATLDLLT